MTDNSKTKTNNKTIEGTKLDKAEDQDIVEYKEKKNKDDKTEKTTNGNSGYYIFFFILIMIMLIVGGYVVYNKWISPQFPSPFSAPVGYYAQYTSPSSFSNL